MTHDIKFDKNRDHVKLFKYFFHDMNQSFTSLSFFQNETCLPFMTHDIFNHELYESYCPCEQGLECRGVTVDEAEHSVVHHNPRCQPPES